MFDFIWTHKIWDGGVLRRFLEFQACSKMPITKLSENVVGFIIRHITLFSVTQYFFEYDRETFLNSFFDNKT